MTASFMCRRAAGSCRGALTSRLDRSTVGLSALLVQQNQVRPCKWVCWLPRLCVFLKKCVAADTYLRKARTTPFMFTTTQSTAQAAYGASPDQSTNRQAIAWAAHQGEMHCRQHSARKNRVILQGCSSQSGTVAKQTERRGVRPRRMPVLAC